MENNCNTSYKTLAFDVDGVMADLLGHYVTTYNELHPDDLIAKDQFVDYDFVQKLNIVCKNSPSFMWGMNYNSSVKYIERQKNCQM